MNARLMILAFGIPLLFHGGVKVGASTTNLYEYFDTNTVGSVPAGWSDTSQSGGSFSVSSNQFRSASNSVQIMSLSSQFAGIGTKAFSTSISSNSSILTIASFSAFPAGTNANAYWSLQGSGGTNILYVHFDPVTGKILASSGGGTTNMGTYLANKWYDFTINLAPANHAYDITIYTNNINLSSATGIPIERNDMDFGRMQLVDYAFGIGSSSIYFDSISVLSGETIPEPSVCMLSGIALLAAFKRFRIRAAHNYRIGE